MIIVLKKDSANEQVHNLITWIEAQGLGVHISKGEESTVLGLIGNTSKLDADLIEGLDILKTVNYEYIKHQYGLYSQSDIVWLRFTIDGYLGVVASSNDINFSYDTNSGRLIQFVNKEWDENRIIIIPLPNIKSRQERLLIEKMIGNYLNDNNVPIIDLYSHNLGE